MQKSNIPRHIGFIMDGNRRWAKKHKLEMIMGHHQGAEQIEKIVEHGAKRGVSFMTFWAFSTENWNRGETEVQMLMQVFRHVLRSSIVDRFITNGVQLRILGEYKAFPQDIVVRIEDIMERSRENRRITVNIALNYGGRAEILRAVKTLCSQQESEEIDEERFASALYTHGQPDPDMIVRTGGEQRLSGFLPWQAVYSELYFTETLWPDFDEKAFALALEEYERRERRFGK